jgi:uncharacterized protein
VVSYDVAKREINLRKHGIDLAELVPFFGGPILTREDLRHSYGELRFQSVGWHREELIFVVWAPDENDSPHLISARKAEKHECKAWAMAFR